jgi:hypothetical protein
MNNKRKLFMLKKRLYQLTLAGVLANSLTMNLCGCKAKKSECSTEVVSEVEKKKPIKPYIEVTTPNGYELMPGAVAVKNEDVDKTEIGTLCYKSNSYKFLGANHGSLLINGEYTDLKTIKNEDGSITYKAPNGYQICEPYYVGTKNGNITEIRNIDKLELVVAEQALILKK